MLLFVTLIDSDAYSFASTISSEENSWTTKTPMPTARVGLCVAVVDGKIYAIGGSTGNYCYVGVNEMYDPETDTWTTMEPMPTPRADFAIAVYQNKIYCIGGQTSVNQQGKITGQTEVYDPATNTWETKASMPTPRCFLEANVVDDKIYVIGGKINSNSVSTKNEAYDPATDSWYTVVPESMPTGIYVYASAVIDDKIYIIGGLTQFGWWPTTTPTNKTLIYDVQTDEWTKGESLPYLIDVGAATATTGVNAPQRIYVIGGYRWVYSTTCEVSCQVSVYDPITKTWTFGEDMPTSRVGLAVAVVNDKIYAIGGYESDSSASTVNEEYTPVGYKEPKVMSIFVDSPANKTYYTDTIKLQFVINKTASRVMYSLDSKDNVSLAENPTLTLSGLSDGSHSITVYAQDAITGKYAKSQTVYFTVQTCQETLCMAVIGVIAVIATGIIYRKWHKPKTGKKVKI
ncbi:MAG: kelch repeat-containing protein [Candidatus Bathyarchaeia archaeon]